MNQDSLEIGCVLVALWLVFIAYLFIDKAIRAWRQRREAK